MRTRIALFVSVALLASIACADKVGPGGSPLFLTGMVGFPTDANGNWHTGWYNTYGSALDFGKNAYVVASDNPNGAFINSGNGQPTMVHIDLSRPGTYKFLAFFDGNEIYRGRDFWGMNLFFNDQNNTPSISVFASPKGASGSEPGFLADSGATLTLDGQTTILGSGQLEAHIGDKTIRLTQYSTDKQDVYNLDRVSNFSLGSSQKNDHVTEFALQVVPEPVSFAPIVIGLAALIRRNRCKASFM